MENEEPDLSDADLSDLDRSLFFALCTPLARLAVRRGIALRSLKHMLGMAYFHETRRQGLTGNLAAKRMDVSLRTITLLSRQLKDFLTVENQHSLPRKLEYLLWADPISAARLKQTVRGADSNEIDEALKLLVEQGRVQLRDDGRYQVTRKQFTLVDNDDFGARVDGMKNQLEAVADSITARFVEGLPEEEAFARTYTVRIRRSETNVMMKNFYPLLRLALIGMEHGARDEDDLVEMAMSITWSPHKMVDQAD